MEASCCNQKYNFPDDYPDDCPEDYNKNYKLKSQYNYTYNDTYKQELDNEISNLQELLIDKNIEIANKNATIIIMFLMFYIFILYNIIYYSI